MDFQGVRLYCIVVKMDSNVCFQQVQWLSLLDSPIWANLPKTSLTKASVINIFCSHAFCVAWSTLFSLHLNFSNLLSLQVTAF